jgi:regulator of RNase E activity RraA
MMKRQVFPVLALAACGSIVAWAPFAAPADAASGDPIVEEFKLVALASVSDAVDQVIGKRGFMNYDMRPVIDGKLVGRAVTAKLVPTKEGQSTASSAVSHSVQMIDEANPGDVGVIVIEDGLNVAAVGGLMMTAAKSRGMAGMVLDGGARDIPELRALGLPVYARSYTPATAVGRYTSVSKNETVVCAGVSVSPGDVIVADIDGVVVVPKDQAKKILESR